MGAINVAEEHYATAVAQSILDGLGRDTRRPPKDGRLAIVSGTPQELHALGTRVVADFLEADGWEVLQLGPGAPAADITSLVESEQPDLVALSTATASVLEGVAEVLRSRPHSIPGRASWPWPASSGRRRRARPLSSSAPTWSCRTRASWSRHCTSASHRCGPEPSGESSPAADATRIDSFRPARAVVSRAWRR